MAALMTGSTKSTKLAFLASTVLAAACGPDGPQMPPVPTPEQRLEVAERIDETQGFDPFIIGMPLSKVINVGKPDSYVYVDDGVKLSAYRKANVAVKIGGTPFPEVSLFFGKSNEMQMYRFSRAMSHDIDDARAKAKEDDKEWYIPEEEKEARLETFRVQHKAACESAGAKFTETWGLGTPEGLHRLVWKGNEIQASWEYASVRGMPTCLLEVRAVHPR